MATVTSPAHRTAVAPPASLDVPCTICRSEDRAEAYVVDGWPIVRCRSCAHLFVSPRPPMVEIQSLYDENYFANPAFGEINHDAYFGYADYITDRERIQANLGAVLARIEGHTWKGRMLDIGCGLGFFVETAAARGWDAWGIDLNAAAVEWAQANVHQNVLHGTVEASGFEDDSFDCVTMFDVIEHIADPRAELAEMWRVLRPGGLLVIVTPDAGALVSRMLGSHWLEMKRAPEHLHFFSVAGLAQVLTAAGFTASEWHSIGKIATLRSLLGDLKFYSPAFFGNIERRLTRRGWDDRVVNIDPHTKFCMYARKTHAAMPLDEALSLSTDRGRASQTRRVERDSLVRRALRRLH